MVNNKIVSSSMPVQTKEVIGELKRIAIYNSGNIAGIKEEILELNYILNEFTGSNVTVDFSKDGYFSKAVGSGTVNLSNDQSTLTELYEQRDDLKMVKDKLLEVMSRIRNLLG